MARIQDVAAASGVSVSTVSRALRGIGTISDATRARIRAAADDLGYIPSSVASGLVTGRAMSMAIVVPFIGRWFYSTVVQGVDSALRPVGYDLSLLNLGDPSGVREREFHRALLRKRADALITLAFATNDSEAEQLRALQVPVIAVGGRVEGLRSIGIDDLVAADLAVRHLLDLGHRRIAHVGGIDEQGLHPRVPTLRRERWEQLVGPVPDRWFARGGFTIDGALAATLEMLADPADRPTAIFAASDEMAFGVILAARRLGLRIPQDLSVVGIDDHDFAEAFGLTTVRQDAIEQGRLAAQSLVDELAGRPGLVGSVYAPCELIVRSTTAPLR